MDKKKQIDLIRRINVALPLYKTEKISLFCKEKCILKNGFLRSYEVKDGT